ncbi:hypothetical protein [Pseudomonas sp. Larv2_ips]|uniref:hypothetical protein n=1 Tax=Pseudomonas sp. Larv2_ips TaxID=1896942 RepID=UPI0013006D79|nr:hypothetical protein [Pseudomonas sp. Larv2_ips]
MPLRLKRLKQAIQNPASTNNAIHDMRDGIVKALSDWPVESYAIADAYAPHGGSITEESRAWLRGLCIVLDQCLPIDPSKKTVQYLEEIKSTAGLLAY